MKLNIIPLSWCSAIWQCAIHQSRVGDVEQDVDDLAGTHEHGVLPHQVGLDLAVAGQDQEPSRAVNVEGVMHRMVGVHLVDQADLDPVPDGEPPIDRRVRLAGRAVDELPAHVGGGRDLVDLDHVVLPLNPACPGVRVMLVTLVVFVALVVVRVDFFDVLAVNGGVVVLVRTALIVVAFIAVVFMLAGGPGSQRSRQQLHPAQGAPARLVPHHVEVHGARVRRGAGGHREQLHSALWAPARLVLHHVGVHRARVGRRDRLGQQHHAAAWAASGFVLDDAGMHWAFVDDRAIGLLEVHLGHERQRLVRFGRHQAGQPLPLGAQLRVASQVRKLLAERRLGDAVADGDPGELIDAVGSLMHQRQFARLLEERVDDDPFGRRQHDLFDELLMLDPAAVAADELHPRTRQLDLEHAGVGGIGQEEPNDLSGLRGQLEIGFAGDQQHVPEATHRRVRGLGA